MTGTKTRGVKAACLAPLVSLFLCCIAPGAHAAQRELHWEALDVRAHLDADGVLDVVERHTLVFTGDWNGGERVFNMRARQRLEFVSLERIDTQTGEPRSLQETSSPDNVDEFVWADRRTLRWRSRRPSDPAFANTPLTYVLHYRLSGILLNEDGRFRIDHDFAFPNRPGPIASFTLELDLDPAWQPVGEFRNRYSADDLIPGRSFVLNISLRYSGSITPVALDSGRPLEVVVAVLTIFGGCALFILAFVSRERSLGRFAPVDTMGINSAWIERNILAYPAEVVGGAWDGSIGTPEVVALIARMTAEKKLESTIEGTGAMRLRLKVDRSTLSSHERALVDGLFFDQRTETSTKQVQEHYKSTGFDPATVIRPFLSEQVKKVIPAGELRVGLATTIALFLAGVFLLAWSVYSAPEVVGAAVGAAVFTLFLSVFLQIPGWLFRSRMDWGPRAAALLLLPALSVCLGLAAFLWFVVGTDKVELPWTMVGGLSAFALCIANGSINGMKSRQGSTAIAFRKRLTTGRSFFVTELNKSKPNLRDSWYPWLLAFGLGKQVDVWSSNHGTETSTTTTWSYGSSSSSSSSSSSHSQSSTGWSGGGGLSGGAGATGVWAAAAAGMAAGVAAPSSGDSSGGGSSSSSGGSSGGGGGGGW
jgi:uncharacterized membrane protein YgcG